MNKLWTFLLGVATVGVAIAAPASASEAQRPNVTPGGTAVVACADPEVSNLDPVRNNLGTCTRSAMMALYDALVYIDKKGNARPRLATSWSTTNGRRTYIFRLRPDARFHDGSLVDAAAVRFSILRMLAPTALGQSTLIKGVIRRVRVINRRTVRIDLFRPNAVILYALGSTGAAPIVNPRIVAARDGDLSTTDAGSGPFVLGDHRFGPGGFVEFRRFNRYWERVGNRRLPYLDGFTLRPLIDDNARILNLRSRTIDVAQRIPVTRMREVRDAGLFVLGNLASGITTQFGVNPNVAPFTNKLVRQAVCEAIDRRTIMRTTTLNNGWVRPTPFAPGSIYDITRPNFTYNVASARRKLQRAGFANGFTTQISIINRQPDAQIAQLLRQQLGEVGIRLDIEALDRATWIDVNRAKREPMLLTRGTQYIEPEIYIAVQWDPASSNANNFIGWNDADARRLWQFTRRAAAESNPQRRRALYVQAVGILVDNCAWSTMMHQASPDATVPNMKGVDAYAFGEIVMTRAWRQG